MKRLHTLMLFLVFLFIGVSPDTNAATVNRHLNATQKPGLASLVHVQQRTSYTKVTLPTELLSTKH